MNMEMGVKFSHSIHMHISYKLVVKLV